MRAFDLLTKAEQEIRVSDQPRYNLEMALLRLMHLRKLAPLSELLGLAEKDRVLRAPVPNVPRVPKRRHACGAKLRHRAQGSLRRTVAEGAPRDRATQAAPWHRQARWAADDGSDLKDRLLAEIKSAKSTFYNLVVAQAFRSTSARRVSRSSFKPTRRTRSSSATTSGRGCSRWPKSSPAGRCRCTITLAEPAARRAGVRRLRRRHHAPARKTSRPQAMANATVQAVLEIFPVEKTTVEESIGLRASASRRSRLRASSPWICRK